MCISHKPKYWPKCLSPWPLFLFFSFFLFFFFFSLALPDLFQGFKVLSLNKIQSKSKYRSHPHGSSPEGLHSCIPDPKLNQTKTKTDHKCTGHNAQSREGAGEGRKLVTSYFIIPTKINTFLLFDWLWFCHNDKDAQCSRSWDWEWYLVLKCEISSKKKSLTDLLTKIYLKMCADYMSNTHMENLREHTKINSEISAFTDAFQRVFAYLDGVPIFLFLWCIWD